MNHIRNAIWMKERGHQVVFFCVNGSAIDRALRKEEIEVIHIQPHRKYYDFSKGKQLVRLLQKGGFTHLLLRSTSDLSIAAIVKQKLRDKIHTSYFMEMQLGVKKKNLLHSLRFRKIDLWSCPLNWLKEQVETMTNFQGDLRVIPSGLELSKFENLPTQIEARKTLELPENKMIFGLVGRIDPQKGQLLLLEAMKKAKQKSFHVLLLGDPTVNEGDEYVNQVMAVASDPDLKERVHIRPFMKDIPVFYRAIDWLVMATKSETFGMVTVEAMASGTPILGSNKGGTPELIQNGDLGVLFESMDTEDLAKKIDQIIEKNLTIPSEKLIKAAKLFDHHEVCDQVEKALDIQHK
jgi:glycosyltransferase involved in cell wall biosynthesis